MGSKEIKSEIIKSVLLENLDDLYKDVVRYFSEDTSPPSKEEFKSIVIKEKNWTRVTKFLVDKKEHRVFKLRQFPVLVLSIDDTLLFSYKMDGGAGYDISEQISNLLFGQITLQSSEADITKAICNAHKKYLGETILDVSSRLMARYGDDVNVSEIAHDLLSFCDPSKLETSLYVKDNAVSWDADLEDFKSEYLADSSFRLMCDISSDKVFFEFNED